MCQKECFLSVRFVSIVMDCDGQASHWPGHKINKHVYIKILLFAYCTISMSSSKKINKPALRAWLRAIAVLEKNEAKVQEEENSKRPSYPLLRNADIENAQLAQSCGCFWPNVPSNRVLQQIALEHLKQVANGQWRDSAEPAIQ